MCVSPGRLRLELQSYSECGKAIGLYYVNSVFFFRKFKKMLIIRAERREREREM